MSNFQQQFVEKLERTIFNIFDSVCNKIPSFINQRNVIFFVLTIVSLAIFYDLKLGDLKDWDEGMYAWRAKVIVYKGGGYWLDQSELSFPGGFDSIQTNNFFYSGSFPPLHIWMMTISYKTFGINSFAARLPSALLGIITIFSLFIAGRRMGRSQWAGFWAAFAIGTCMFWLEYVRKAQFDGPMISFMALTIALYSIWYEERKTKWLVLTGVALGLGLMTKIVLVYFVAVFIGIAGIYRIYAQHSPAACRTFLIAWLLAILSLFLGLKFMVLILVLLLAGMFVLNRKASIAYIIEQGTISLIGFAVAAPWHIYMTVKHGKSFWDWYIGYHLINRTGQTLDNHQGNWYYYVNAAWDFIASPAIGLIVFGIFFGIVCMFIRKLDADKNEQADSQNWRDILFAKTNWNYLNMNFMLLISWVAITFLIISVSPTRRQVYMLLTVPGFVLLAAVMLQTFATRIKNTPVMCIGFYIVLFAIVLRRSKSLVDKVHLEIAIKGYENSIFENIFVLVKLLFPLIIGIGIFVIIVGFLLKNTRLLRTHLVFIICTMFLVESYRLWKDMFKADDPAGKHNYGWASIEPFVQDRDDYDVMVFWGRYWDPAITYYFDGLYGLRRELNIFGKPYVHIDFGTHKEIRDAFAKLPKDKRLLLVNERRTGYIGRFGPEFKEEMLSSFTLHEGSHTPTADGGQTWIEAHYRDPQ